MTELIAVGGQLTVTQVDLLRGICILVDCPVPVIPADVVYENAQGAPQPPETRNVQAARG